MADIDMDTRGLDKLIKALNVGQAKIKIGILGDSKKITRSNESGTSKLNNPTIGAYHEFGLGVPQRSFLRAPLTYKLSPALRKNGVLSVKELKEVVATGSLLPWLQKIAFTAEAVVADGFATGGYGKWKPSNMKNKKVHQTLVETQQLRDSIETEVVIK